MGIGVLFGLELYRYEFAGLLMHAEHLEAVHGVGPHTISVPRIKHADDIDPDSFDNGIDDETFAKICALIRISVPYTGMIISTRESKAVREKVIRLGVSQISGASCTSVGGYAEPEEEDENTAQFDVSDNRTLDEVVNWLMGLGYIPSFCTACYREGRTGDRFMSLCKSGQIQNCCHPNALMTLKEYLMDYASEDTRKIGEKLIEKELLKIPNEKVRKILNKDLDFLDSIQTETSTARQFLFIARCKSSKSENVLQKANRVEKIISDQGFEVTRMKKADIKRFLAIYFDASMNGDLMHDYDGEQYFEKEQTYEEA